MAGGHSRKERIPRVSPVDRHVSSRMLLRRQAVGLSQQQLAELIGTTYQQVYRYERGINRITAAQLHTIALVLGTDVAFFFEDIEPDLVATGQGDYQRRLIELTSTVLRIAKPEHRHAVCVLAKALAGLSDQQPPEPA